MVRNIILVDFSWMYHKNWAVIKNLSRVIDGVSYNTGGVFGCVQDIRRLQTTYGKDVRLVLEPIGGNFRKEISDTYKVGRVKDPDLYTLWDETIRMLLKIPNVTAVTSQDKGEADDLIYTLYKKEKTPDTRFFVFTRDKDLLQICRDNDEEAKTVFGLAFKVGSREPIDFDSHSREVFGVPCSKVAFMKSLLGDGSDNIPRLVERFPYKVALELALKYDSPKHAIDSLKQSSVVQEYPAGVAKWLSLLLVNADRWLHHYDLVRLVELSVMAYAPEDGNSFEMYEFKYGMKLYGDYVRYCETR